MGTLKSLLSIWKATAFSLAERAPDLRSVNEVISRSNREGLSFLTVRLPSLFKALLPCLEDSTAAYLIPTGFKTQRGSVYPILFSEYFSKILTKDGLLRTDLSDDFIGTHLHALRQCTEMFYKFETEMKPALAQETMLSFISRQEDMKHSNAWANGLSRYPWVMETAKRLVRRILGGLDPYDIRPTHSTGAVAEGRALEGSDRWTSFASSWDKRLDSHYPISDYGVVSYSHWLDSPHLEFSKPEPAARLACVPKDSRGPRLICCEPAARQFIQQGLKRLLHSQLSHAYVTVPGVGRIKLSSVIPLHDQSVMRSLAEASSTTRFHATIDLKDASDSIDWRLLEFLLPQNWLSALEACRSTSVSMTRDGLEYPLQSAFPMGSSICFPMECIVFWSIAQAAVLFTSSNELVACYGDDLIVPSDAFTVVKNVLTSCGFIVNAHKSFVEGYFRESCGGDYWKGSDLTIHRLYHDPLDFRSNRNWQSFAAYIEFLNEIIIDDRYSGERGIDDLVRIADDIAILPHNPRSILSIDRRGWGRNALFPVRWNRDLQIHEIKSLLITRRKTSNLDGYPAILRSLLSTLGGPASTAGEFFSPDDRCLPRWQYLLPEE